jgi:hypothetical protein
MSGIDQGVVFSVVRMKSEFRDPVGNRKSISGTGFWLANDGARVFVTNRHNVDPRLVLGAKTALELEKVQIRFRRYDPSGPLNELGWFEVTDVGACLVSHATADVAVLREPSFTDMPSDFHGGRAIPVTDIADMNFFRDSLRLFDLASFVGFPGGGGAEWWDTGRELPIARACYLASVPSVPFENDSIETDCVVLVSGFSFSGSSGSPVISHAKGMKVGSGLEGGRYAPPRLLGIMSGHFRDRDTEPAMFQHTGLSYYTSSIAMLSLL